MPEEVGKPGTVPRRSAPRTNSSSSLSSNGSTSSNATISSQSNGGVQNGELTWGTRKKPTRGIWPSTKAEPVSGVTTARTQSVPLSSSGPSAASAISSIVPTQNATQSQPQQGIGKANQALPEGTAVLYLSPLNGTFERKTITVPFAPDILRIGRQTNQKTVPTPTNGFFDSKVLSRQHAEVWADKDGQVWIRDVKSSNGTFVNGARLSQENKDSEPHMINGLDHLELGIDIVSEDHKHIVHHKVSARVERAGIHGAGQEQPEIRTQEQPPQASNGQPVQSQGQGNRSRSSSQGQLGGPGHFVNPRGNALNVVPAYQAKWLQPVTMEQIVKRLNGELRQARSQGQNLGLSDNFVGAVTGERGLPAPPLQKLISPNRTFDSKSRFPIEPPAPPPQQPLPEKPDGPPLRTKAKELSGLQPQLRRMDTERPRMANGTLAGKPSKHEDPPQVPKLVEMLNNAQKEITTHVEKLREMEEALQKEREARSSAEARASRLESAKLIPGTSLPLSNPSSLSPDSETKLPESAESDEDIPARVQQKLDLMNAEMDGMRAQMERYRQRAEVAEAESERNRKTLTEMVKGIRKREDAAAAAAKEKRDRLKQELLEGKDAESTSNPGTGETAHSNKGADAHEKAVSKDASSEALTNGVLTIGANVDGEDGRNDGRRKDISHAGDNFATGSVSPPKSIIMDVISPESSSIHSPQEGDKTASTTSTSMALASQGAFVQSAPYASMLGVILLGVGMMAYLNGWQNIPRER